MADRTYIVKATWDDEAKMWVADSDDIPGVAAEAEDQEKLLKKLQILIPEMMELNHVPVDRSKAIEVVIRYVREDRLRVPTAA